MVKFWDAVQSDKSWKLVTEFCKRWGHATDLLSNRLKSECNTVDFYTMDSFVWAYVLENIDLKETQFKVIDCTRWGDGYLTALVIVRGVKYVIGIDEIVNRVRVVHTKTITDVYKGCDRDHRRVKLCK